MALTEADSRLVAQLKNRLGTGTAYNDEELFGFITVRNGSLDRVAADIWVEKAAGYAELTDVKEGSSTRPLGDLYEQALKMADFYNGLADDAERRSTRRSRTRAITRP